MKFVKAAVLIAVGVKLLTLFGRDVGEWAADFVTRHGIDTANRFVESTLTKLNGFGNTQIVTFSTVAFAYSGLLLTEGVGLWMQKRWAEYLTAAATALFIPLELYELYERFTWVRIAILILNIFVVWYLVTRLRDEMLERNNAAETKVKICGITNKVDGLHAVECGADELGFNFYEKSPRHIEPDAAKEIIEGLGNKVIKVGVFVNASREKILEIAEYVGLDAVQLHGDEDNEFVADLREMTDLVIIKAVRVKPDLSIEGLIDHNVNAVLIDGYSAEAYGGTGGKADWKTAKMICEALSDVYLAGGLTPENVARAIRTVRPGAVDVASGVESSPGKKDPQKVESFIKAAKNAI